ncbi:unknown [Prevotella sp. CAG:1185]|nr:unknown [Prevotella sp. CAG:1185]
MIKQLLLATTVAIATSVCAQSTSDIPTLNEMKGDFLVLNSQEYDGVTSLASMKPFTMSPNNDNTISIDGFYMNGCLAFNAEYNEKTGSISIPSGTPIFDMDTYMVYLYPWNSETEEEILRPIEYKYIGNDTWECNTDLMLVATQGDEKQTVTFSNGSRLVRCNGKSDNISYVGAAGSQDEYIESRPSYITINGNSIDVYNILTADQYGYGVHLSGTLDRENGEVMFNYTLTGHANDGTYRILTGCEYDSETNMPTGMSFADTENVGKIYATINLEKGEIALNPMAIWPAEYDATTGSLSVDDTQLYEFVKSVNVSYDVNSSETTAIDKPAVNDAGKEVAKIEYYAVDGSKLSSPKDGTLVIKVTTYKDKATKSEKIIFN